MDELVAKHLRRLRLAFLAFVALLAGLAALAFLLPPTIAPALPQAQTLLWGFAFLAAANLATVMPTYRAMMAGPRRVHAVGRQPERLLASHLSVHLLALARVDAVAVLGLALLFLTGRRDWFWAFVAAAAAGACLLWPRRWKVVALLAAPAPSRTGQEGGPDLRPR
ncbi:MAG TPA: hypothetical protein VLW17_02455 [Thermoanaerobaculaceae bacterium]|nr:hypothetical protein [Thermoanaerobaculaceae bacterium]